ncbi:protein TonB [Reichenbachiella agariperforans]|uniref:Protein TonB n=1 Tax=Reichenbachiella agariperforans TaxID=156994 RepID=A0A1M6NBW7_REIAG|nr:energy transducer TonB [Reichenbachiella agariperforans]SHJ93157.1 protein TonB [Reichenbachiella agariperforans]
MELRKNPAIDLERKRGMFFSIGLVTSLSLVLMAFNWRTEEVVPHLPEPEVEYDVFYVIEPVAAVIKSPERPKAPIERKSVQAPVFVETQEEIEALVEIEELTIDIDDVVVVDEELEEEEPDVYIGVVEQMPEPVGGMASFYSHIGREMKYPNRARRDGVEGRVFVQFVVDRDGSIAEIEVIKGISTDCDEEAARVLATVPRWNPGKQRGKPVRVRMIVPIVFRLN